MNAVTRTTQTATNALVAVVVAVLALFAVPTRAVAAAPSYPSHVIAQDSGAAPLLRSAQSRKSRAHPAAALAEPRVPPVLPTVTLLVAAALLLFGVLRPVIRRFHTVAAFRLPAVRAPPARLA
jgi:hypothetical protein